MTLYHGDCRDVMATLPDASVDAVVTDPPYGLSFMGKGWDHGVPGQEFWAEALRVAKPGAHLLAFGGTRTFHRLAVAIEDAGWEIRDCVMWVYGSGFPKSHNIGKAIDKMAGAERKRTGKFTARHGGRARNKVMNEFRSQDYDPETGKMFATAPATEAARQWQGWGTALKPSWEPVIVARKPLVGTVAENVLAWGTGAINVDGCRVGTEDVLSFGSRELGDGIKYGKCKPTTEGQQHTLGRWPANLIHDGSEEVTGLLGDAARFFYCAKASKRDRDEGCEGLEERVAGAMIGNQHSVTGRTAGDGVTPVNQVFGRNHHPTVKPADLMRYLCRLVTPPGGVVLDPFMGSGSTGKACALEGFSFIGIEREAEYVEIARARIAAVSPEPVEPVAPARRAPAPKPAPAGQLSLFDEVQT